MNMSVLPSSEAPPRSIPDMTLLCGPLILGVILSSGLFGVLCVQVFVYHIAFPNDSRWIKAYVLLAFSVEAALTILVSYAAWWTLESGYGDVSRIFVFDHSSNAQQPLTGLATSLYHAFYCWRIFMMTRSMIVPIIAGIISTLQLTLSIYVGVYIGRQQDKTQSLHGQMINGIVTAWLLGAAVTDIIITCTMVTILVKHRKNSVYQATTTKLHRLIKFTAETGLFTTCAAIMGMIVYLTSQSTYWYFTVFFVLAKAYSNTLMASLNLRIISNMHSGPDVIATVDMPSNNHVFWSSTSDRSETLNFTRKAQSPLVKLPGGTKTNVGIHVVTDTECNLTADDGEFHPGIHLEDIPKQREDM